MDLAFTTYVLTIVLFAVMLFGVSAILLQKSVSLPSISSRINLMSIISGVCVATIGILQFQQIIETSIAYPPIDNLPGFYFYFDEVGHFHILSIVTTMVLAAIAFSVGLVGICKTKGIFKDWKGSWMKYINAIVLTAFVYGVGYYVYTTPVKAEDFPFNFTTIDGATVQAAFWHQQVQLFYFIALVSITYGLLLALSLIVSIIPFVVSTLHAFSGLSMVVMGLLFDNVVVAVGGTVHTAAFISLLIFIRARKLLISN